MYPKNILALTLSKCLEVLRGLMSLFSFWKSKALSATEFSEFIRNAKPSEKKRVYTEVLKGATERQQAAMARNARVRS